MFARRCEVVDLGKRMGLDGSALASGLLMGGPGSLLLTSDGPEES